MHTILQFSAPCLFGLEGLVADEARALGADRVEAQNGRVLFEGDATLLARANLWLRCAERVELVLGSFPARTFDELFEGVKALPLENYIGSLDAFPVKGWSIESALHSIPDCQSIVKKAAVERLKQCYRKDWFEETGPVHALRFSILKDRATLTLDTSGAGLHKRGYREHSTLAPLKETLAAGMVILARLYHDSVLYDPFCGSGTLLIEGAMLAKNIAPGLRRAFSAERWGCFDSAIWRAERARCLDLIEKNDFRAVGWDISPEAVELTRSNAVKAGVKDCLWADVADIRDFSPTTPRGVVVCNPPYGERLLDVRAAEELYRVMGRVFEKKRGYRYSIISPHEGFEKLFGRPADKRRKLYNGMIRCQDFMYFKA